MRVSVYITLQILFRELGFGGGLQTSHYMVDEGSMKSLSEHPPAYLVGRLFMTRTVGRIFIFVEKSGVMSEKVFFRSIQKAAAKKATAVFYANINTRIPTVRPTAINPRPTKKNIFFSKFAVLSPSM